MAESKVEKRGAVKSNFSVTCRMLSQYMKKKRSFGGISLEMAPTALIERQQAEGIFQTSAKTMSLLPGTDVSLDEEIAGDAAGGGVPEPMDLFPQHAGFGCPAALAKEESPKAPEITRHPDMTKAQLTIFYGGRVLVWNDFPADKARYLMQMAMKENAAALSLRELAPTLALPTSENASDMPMMVRRNSLHRFLEKRKDRINGKAPYQMHGDSSDVTKAELGKFWLGLGRQNNCIDC